MTYSVTIWGTRGSIPTPGAATVRYGGNTPSLSVELKDNSENRVIVLDAGTGIRPLGNHLSAREGSVEVDLLVSHTHWDHIQGLPFFTPFFDSNNSVRIWGPKQDKVDLVEILRHQMHPVVFPVPLDDLAAQLGVSHIESEVIEIAGFTVSSMQVRHPGKTLGYRLAPETGGPTVAYIPDNELGPGGNYEVGSSWRAAFVRFLQGVDVLIHDAMFTPSEIGQHRGWGHSSWDETLEIASEAGVGQLVLFHHRPEHDDVAMDTILAQARERSQGLGAPVETVVATEGMELTL